MLSAYLHVCLTLILVFALAGGAAVQKALGRGESMVVEFGCVAAVSEDCKIVAEERTGLIREPPYTEGFLVKITGEHSFRTTRFTDSRGRCSIANETGVYNRIVLPLFLLGVY